MNLTDNTKPSTSWDQLNVTDGTMNLLNVQPDSVAVKPWHLDASNDDERILSFIQFYLEATRGACESLNQDYDLRQKLYAQADALARRAYENRQPDAMKTATAILEKIYYTDFNLRSAKFNDSDVSPILRDIASTIERHYIDFYLKADSRLDTSNYPRNGKDYVRWFKDIIQSHVSSNHEFYDDFLPHRAQREHLRFYLCQETNLDPKFDDILAYIQVGHGGQQKMEIAINYWDEMGNGNYSEVHSSLFQKTLNYLNVDSNYVRTNLFPESIASGNMSSCLAIYRRHSLRALGYFGTAEYIGPRRFKSLLTAWERNELDPAFSEYHRLHISIDAIHGNAWLNNVIAPLIDRDPDLGEQIAQGMLLRLESSNDYLDALQKKVVLL